MNKETIIFPKGLRIAPFLLGIFKSEKLAWKFEIENWEKRC